VSSAGKRHSRCREFQISYISGNAACVHAVKKTGAFCCCVMWGRHRDVPAISKQSLKIRLRAPVAAQPPLPAFQQNLKGWCVAANVRADRDLAFSEPSGDLSQSRLARSRAGGV
jgi:hypothetical protein